MRRILLNSFLAVLAAGMVGASGLISSAYHSARWETASRLRPERFAPYWVSRFVERFHEKNDRLPSQSEMETLAAREFANDVRRMKVTWLGEVRWGDGERGGNVSTNSDKP